MRRDYAYIANEIRERLSHYEHTETIVSLDEVEDCPVAIEVYDKRLDGCISNINLIMKAVEYYDLMAYVVTKEIETKWQVPVLKAKIPVLRIV